MTARRTGRLAAVVAAVGAIVLGAAAPAVADDSLTVSVVVIEASKVNLVATVPGASATDLPTVSVRFDDTALSSSVSVVDAAQAQAQAPPRAVVVVIDTSGSMAGAPIQAARDAATEFVGTVPTDVEIGVVGRDLVRSRDAAHHGQCADRAQVHEAKLLHAAVIFDGGSSWS